MTPGFWIKAASAAMFLAVAFGAFGAHGLKNVLSDAAKITFETGVRYHLIHGLALMTVAWAASRENSQLVTTAGFSFVAGIVLFSGSLYLLSLTGIRLWGAVTPFGGLAFLIGWLCLFFARI